MVSPIKTIDYEKLKQTVYKTSKDLFVDGSFVLLQTPQGEFIVSYGTTKKNHQKPPHIQTHFRIASNTKTMTAAVIVQQAQEGKLNFQDRVSEYVDDVPNGDQITIEQLLNMRSGLDTYTSSCQIIASLDTDPDKVWKTDEILDIALNMPPYSFPDFEYFYSNTNYALLGVIAEKIDDKSLSVIFENRLFKPLHLKNTLLPKAKSNKLPRPFSHGYQFVDSSYALIDKPFSPYVKASVRNGTYEAMDVTFQNPSYASAAGGVISTAYDLAIWIKSLVTGQLFNNKYYLKWLNSLKPQDPTQPNGQQYGYGISQIRFSGNRLFFHGGELPGYNSAIAHDLVNDITLIVWTNLPVSIDGQTPANTLMIEVLDEVYTNGPSTIEPVP